LASFVKKVLVREGVSAISSRKKFTYNPEMEEDAIRAFYMATDIGLVVRGDFESDLWVVKRNLLFKDTSVLNFGGDVYNFPQYTDPIKTYIGRLLTTMTGAVLQNILNTIKDAILLTEGFHQECVITLRDYLKPSNGAFHVVGFLRFLDPIKFREYIEALHALEVTQPRRPRELAVFHDMLKFKFCVNKYFNDVNVSQEDKLLWYVIRLWWFITNIIPMRPNEFVRIKRNCLSEFDGMFWITVPRSKGKGALAAYVEASGEYNYQEDTLPISQTAYDIIAEYLEMTEEYSESELLFNRKCHLYPGSTIENRQFDVDYFKNYLDKFYDHVVIGEYGRHNADIDRLDPGDTRHYAFINMLLQGFDQLTIMRIGGHESVYSQDWYHSNVSSFASSYTYSLTKMYKEEGGMYTSFVTRDNDIIIESRLDSLEKYKNPKKLKRGSCVYPEIEEKCPFDDHRSCQYFRLSETEINDSEVIDWLKEYSTDLNKRIREQIAIMLQATKGKA